MKKAALLYFVGSLFLMSCSSFTPVETPSLPKTTSNESDKSNIRNLPILTKEEPEVYLADFSEPTGPIPINNNISIIEEAAIISAPEIIEIVEPPKESDANEKNVGSAIDVKQAEIENKELTLNSMDIGPPKLTETMDIALEVGSKNGLAVPTIHETTSIPSTPVKNIQETVPVNEQSSYAVNYKDTSESDASAPLSRKIAPFEVPDNAAESDAIALDTLEEPEPFTFSYFPELPKPIPDTNNLVAIVKESDNIPPAPETPEIARPPEKNNEENTVSSIDIKKTAVENIVPTELTEIKDEAPIVEPNRDFTVPDDTKGGRDMSYISYALIALCVILIILIKVLTNKNKSYKALKKRFDSFGLSSIQGAKEELSNLIEQQEEESKKLKKLQDAFNQLKSVAIDQKTEVQDLQKKIENQKNKFQKNRDLYKAMESAIQTYYTASLEDTGFRPLSASDMQYMDSFAPTVLLALNCMNYQDLRKKFLNNQKQISELLEEFKERYTTKSNRSLYQVMVIALSAELQNILVKLKFGKLEEGKEYVRQLANKFISIADDGNQTIAGTAKKFIYALQKLFEDAVDIEYEYYIKKEQSHQEQLALKARMREEREEQRRLKEQAEQMRREEEKYQQEKERLQEKLSLASSDEEKRIVEEGILKIDEQIATITEKKEEIIKLQHGKAGNVYIISNVGSFGDTVFKIGMTRRLDPQERVDELGSASVPFSFDVHSFIFSEDASGLETELHKRLNDRRVNRVNRRKEFFSVSIDELETLVNEIYPSAEFNKTMLAEEYRQTLSLTQNAFTFGDVLAPEEEAEDIGEEQI